MAVKQAGIEALGRLCQSDYLTASWLADLNSVGISQLFCLFFSRRQRHCSDPSSSFELQQATVFSSEALISSLYITCTKHQPADTLDHITSPLKVFHLVRHKLPCVTGPVAQIKTNSQKQSFSKSADK
ncbi:unnamed protein product [Pleuronectes platessa]|uniref:Uncharacterized protein n=1 Tax=Pleuronectes platessa TaxID=8262 RepID=A0A9N7YZ08_PLEPL|nr:unnamed protein product [Pleuronectes platessa]